jgi:RHS repeat-associated protein
MPIEFTQQPSGGSGHATRLVMMYDGSGRRVSKTLLTRAGDSQGWDTTLVTHYTGIGTEIREYKPRNFTRYTDSAGVEHCVSANPDYGGNASTACPLPDTVKAVIPLPHGLGRYALQDVGQVDENGAPQAFEWYLKNHLGSTMLVYGTGAGTPGGLKAAYDYRSFGEQVTLTSPSTGKVTENFTGKEKDDETGLSYHEARYLDPMLGVWISVDPKRFFSSPYLYMGNGYNPILFADLNGMKPHEPFLSRRKTAEDFARTYNDDSIRENAEYCAAIYSYIKDGQKYYSYNVPLKGDSRSAPFDKYVAPGQTFETTVHAHGAYDKDLYDPITGNDGNFVPSVMPGDYYVNFNLHRVKGPAYLSTPGGHLVEYGVDNIGVLYMNVVPSSGIAADEFSPYIAPGAVDAYDGSTDDSYREK